MINIWTILGIASIFLLIICFKKFGPNSIWGGLTLGIIIGFIIAIISAIKGAGFNWYIIGKVAIIGTLSGFGAELLGIIGTKLFRKSTN